MSDKRSTTAAVTDKQFLALTSKEVRHQLVGYYVAEIAQPGRAGKVIDVEVLDSILGLKTGLEALKYNEHVICHVWSGKELWQAKVSELTSSTTTTKTAFN